MKGLKGIDRQLWLLLLFTSVPFEKYLLMASFYYIYFELI
jgi:hypothetical protein